MNSFFFLILILVVQIAASVLTKMSRMAAEDAKRNYRPVVLEEHGSETLPELPGHDRSEAPGYGSKLVREPLHRAIPARPVRRLVSDQSDADVDGGPTLDRQARTIDFAPARVLQGIVMSEVLGPPKSVFAPRRRLLSHR